MTGCTKISPGCKFCYAERMARRLKAMDNPRYLNGFALTQHADLIDLPLRWRKPRVIFVNSMSDLFHQDVQEAFIRGCFETMRQAYWHTFQILTKRPERVAQMAATLPWPSNLWMGTSVENRDYYHRIEALGRVPVAVRFLSVEPLLGPVADIPLAKIDWMIVGGESGPGARPMRQEWVRELRDRCTESGVAFFFKQWGGVNKKKTGRMLDGQTWDQMPTPTLGRNDERQSLGDVAEAG